MLNPIGTALWSTLVLSLQFQAAMGSPIDKSAETAALREELKNTKHQLAMFHDSWKQAKQACEAWKKEAEGAATLETKLREMEGKVRALQSAAPLRSLAEGTEVNRLPLSKLEQIQQQLKGDLEKVENGEYYLCSQVSSVLGTYLDGHISATERKHSSSQEWCCSNIYCQMFTNVQKPQGLLLCGIVASLYW